VGQGTGLGLAVVHGIVTAHGGQISLESEVGKGTRVRILLPKATGPAAERRSAP
jgi:signal transduction histidine kinase